MQNFNNQNIDIKDLFLQRLILTCCILGLFSLRVSAQSCPPNIDFEDGNFNGWTCYTGYTTAASGYNEIIITPSGGPIPDRHTMYSAANNSNESDFYGGFPVLCPNGSAYSVRLGNNSGGGEAEGLSYQFTIPANRNTYALIYHYAVVFQDPNHLEYQQPRLVIEVTNVTDNSLISCSSFTFIPYGSTLPGFFISPQSDTTPVWCKPWSAVTINLNNMAGKTIQLFFKTADCTFRKHFGYAYLDVNSECSNEFTGATYCPDDTVVTVIAPYGYQNYTWFNNNFSQVLGNQQTINFTPPPPAGTTIAVELIPYNGYGCQDTLYARLVDTLKVKADAGSDKVSCNQNPVMIGVNSKPGESYSWSPNNGLSNPGIANPSAGPSTTTDYVLTARSSGGGCVSMDTVIIKASIIDSSMQLLGKSGFCTTSNDSAVLVVQPTASIQWYKNLLPVTGAMQSKYRITQTGNYYAKLINSDGCQVFTRTQPIKIESPVPGTAYSVKYAVVNIPLPLASRNFGVNVLWKPSTFLDNSTVINPLFKSPIVEDIMYTIEITTASGCLTVDTQLVKTIKEVQIFVPNAFTPNGDGINDKIKPIMYGVKELRSFRIYTRWGQLVYDMQPNEEGWDGRIKGIFQTTNTYVWVLEAEGLDNRIYLKKGSIVLIK